MIPRPPRSTRTDTLSLHDALPILHQPIGGIARQGPRIGGGRMPQPEDQPMKRRPGRKPARKAMSVRADGGGQKRRSTGGQQHMMDDRSEEHTSELQSLMRISYAVFCLKKKKTKKKIETTQA